MTFVILATYVVAFSAEPPTEPVLRVETGMHTATIWRVGIDAANRYLVTGSDDKTVRVWELSSGEGGANDIRLVKILRPPAGQGNEGRIYSVSISPDGRTIASSGWTQFNNGLTSLASDGMTIYLFDRESGTLIKEITGLPSVVYHLAFSKNGKFLVATLYGANGIRIYRTSDYSLAGEDKDYGFDSRGADFDDSGRLVTTSYDGFVRLYDASFKLVNKMQTPGGRQPHAVSFSPDGSRIAVGFNDSTKVDVLSGNDLAYLFSPDLTGVDNGNLIAVSWSSDGRFLYAGGQYQKKIDNDWQMLIRRWSDLGRGGYTELRASYNTILHILPLNGGGIIYGAFDPAIGIINAAGQKIVYKSPVIADYRDNQQGFLVSWDGSEVRFGYNLWGRNSVIFSTREQSVKLDDSNTRSGMSPPITSLPGLTITDWRNNYTPRLNGTALRLQQYERSQSLAISPDGNSFLLGTDWYLRLFDTYGNEKWIVPAPSSAWDVSVSGNGKVAVAAIGDGTIRWYRMTDGKELMALFPHNDKKRWVLWTPTGYYSASVGADELIGWHINNGKDRAADFFPASKFKSIYYRPDIIAKMLDSLDESMAIRLANAESGRKTQETTITQMLPPVVTITSPTDGDSASNSEITVRYVVRSPSGEPVTFVKALVDGRPVSGERGIKVVERQSGDVQEMRISIPTRDCEVSIIAENRYSASQPAMVRIKWTGEKADEFVVKPKLYVLAVGVSKYQDSNLTLGLAAKDARDFGAAMLLQKEGLYRDVVVKVLTDEQATKDEVLDGLDWIQKETTSKDVAMVFFSGHGVNDSSGIYYYLPVNTDIEKLKRTAVPFSDIKNTIASLAGKTLFFVDTCHSGSIMGARRGLNDITGIINELTSAENGAVVFASSTGNQYALEDPAWGNGAFTKALIEGMNGKADYSGRGKISINMLDLYLSERVKELTKGKQTPTTTKPQTIPDFPVAVKR